MIILDNDDDDDYDYDYWLLESTYLSDNLSVFLATDTLRRKNKRTNTIGQQNDCQKR